MINFTLRLKEFLTTKKGVLTTLAVLGFVLLMGALFYNEELSGLKPVPSDVTKLPTEKRGPLEDTVNTYQSQEPLGLQGREIIITSNFTKDEVGIINRDSYAFEFQAMSTNDFIKLFDGILVYDLADQIRFITKIKQEEFAEKFIETLNKAVPRAQSGGLKFSLRQWSKRGLLDEGEYLVIPGPYSQSPQFSHEMVVYGIYLNNNVVVAASGYYDLVVKRNLVTNELEITVPKFLPSSINLLSKVMFTEGGKTLKPQVFLDSFAFYHYLNETPYRLDLVKEDFSTDGSLPTKVYIFSAENKSLIPVLGRTSLMSKLGNSIGLQNIMVVLVEK